MKNQNFARKMLARESRYLRRELRHHDAQAFDFVRGTLAILAIQPLASLWAVRAEQLRADKLSAELSQIGRKMWRNV